MARPFHVRHADGTTGAIDLDLVPYDIVAVDDAGSLRVAADWLLERGHEHVPRYLVATADLWDAGVGTRLADVVAWFEEWRDGQPASQPRRVWCRYTADRWTRARLESIGRTRIRCRREPRGSRTTQTACVRAWWDIHPRLPRHPRPVVELHQYHVRVNTAFAAALRRHARR